MMLKDSEPVNDLTDATPYKSMENSHNAENSRETSAAQRVVSVSADGTQPVKFCSNKISTAKYNFFTFLPKFLFEQFRRYANIFFLLIAILQQFPNVSPTGRYTTAVPLFIILTISAIKEIIEDYKRHKADDYTNNSKIRVLKDRDWHEICWKELQVGDFVKLINHQGIPADIVLLSSSEPHAMSYIETSNLDGETNLKMRQGLPRTSEVLTISDLEKLKGHIACEMPNRHLYEFCGNISLNGEEKYSLSNDQLLLRGATLKNTKWIFGIVVYSGHETKVMLNSTAPPLKRSSVERMTNRYILGLCGLLLSLTLVTSVANVIWTNQNKDIAWYLGFDRLAPNNFGLMLLTSFIMFHTIIPISLQVTLEMVRFIQAHFINVDIEMYDEDSNTPANARTSNLNEELGQVKYIFSDKTGTLTRNVMEFKQCSIGGVMYEKENGGDQDLMSNLTIKPVKTTDIKENPGIDMFWRALAVCHTVVPERDDNNKLIYQASSPDEAALVKAARENGYEFTTRKPDSITIFVKKENMNYEYEVLNVLEFTSLRKRMSVIVKTPEKKIILFTKGADNVIYERLSNASLNGKITLEHLEEFAKIGLRTLCIAYCEISPEEYSKWKTLFHEASVSIDNREHKLTEAAEKIEKNLILIGASAIEDKLQDQVPETISNLAKAGIKIWVLTGDKQETAVNIGYSCQLLTQTMSLVYLDGDSLDKTRNQIINLMEDIGKDNLGKENDIGFIVSGDTLKFALDFDCRDDFLQLALSCKAVICCRVSPSQKAEVVTLVKTKIKESVTLAIGDGANDVGMIQAAHVGVGISGLEGQQAACNSDYAIAQFRFLNRLLLVHGAWNYSRLTKLILYSFYKNVCFFVIQFWFAMLSGFSGQIIFERWSIGFYNVLFTAAPPLALGLFDRSCSAVNSLKYPQLYKETQKSSTFNLKVFLAWIANSLYHSLLLFWLTVLINNHDIPFKNGQTGSLLFLGNCIYTYVVVTVSVKAGLEHIAWTWLSHLAIWGSIATWFLYFIIYSHLFQLFGLSASMALMYQAVFSSGSFWLGLILIPSAALTRDIAWKAVNRTLFESLRERVMQLEKFNEDPGRIIPIVETRKLARSGRIFSKFRSRDPKLDGTSDELIEEGNQVNNRNRVSSGYAFSQEEHGVVSQSQMIREYDSTVRKPRGN